MGVVPAKNPGPGKVKKDKGARLVRQGPKAK
jgi:hypothetical protein